MSNQQNISRATSADPSRNTTTRTLYRGGARVRSQVTDAILHRSGFRPLPNHQNNHQINRQIQAQTHSSSSSSHSHSALSFSQDHDHDHIHRSISSDEDSFSFGSNVPTATEILETFIAPHLQEVHVGNLPRINGYAANANTASERPNEARDRTDTTVTQGREASHRIAGFEDCPRCAETSRLKASLGNDLAQLKFHHGETGKFLNRIRLLLDD